MYAIDDPWRGVVNHEDLGGIMSQQKPKTITLRQLEPGDDFQDSDLVGPARSIGKTDGSLKRYREVNPIPEGFEVCDLADATKVLIGETFLDVNKEGFVKAVDIHVSALDGFGVLAIRPIPIPEPEPMRGESEVAGGLNRGKCAGIAAFPASLIGKVIRWEVVKDGGE